jgi:DNA-binding beta-propeller fold protein YncE
MRLLLATAATVLAASPSTLAVDVGEANYGLAAAGGSVWVGGLDRGDVVRVDPKTGKVLQRVSIGVRVFNLASASGAVWAVANFTQTAARIDARTGRVTATVRVGAAPYDIEWGFGSAWVSNSGDGTVSRITGGRVVKTIEVGVEPNGLSAIGKSLWVTDHTAGKLVRIDPTTNRVTGSVALPGADWVTEAAGSLWVSQETNVVARVDPGTLRVLARVPVKRNPLGSAVVHGQLWVPCIDSGVVVVIDPRTAKVVRSFPAGSGPIVVLPSGGHAWVSHSTGRVVSRL